MPYLFQTHFKCPKCGYICSAGGSDMDYWNKSPITEDGNPICPKCWNEFLKTLGAEMRCVVPFDGGLSDYDKHYNRKNV